MTDEKKEPSAATPKKYYAVDFTFGEVLGEGAFGAVMKATLNETGRDYAIKILEKKHILKENKVKYVKTERNILSMCRHPNIVSLFCTFSDPENLYYVLELCPNGEILTYLKKFGSLDADVARFYIAEAVAAVEYLHDQNIIHRDLKPENLLLSGDMHLKVTDFGTTKQLESDEKHARSNSFVGTAEYVSPELLTVKETCAASDLWALGVLLFQFLTGRMPFHGPTQYMTFQNVINRKFEYPKEDLPEHSKDLIEKLLVMEPEQRLGASSMDDLKNHPFFEGIDWELLSTSTPPEMKASGVTWTWEGDADAKNSDGEEKADGESEAGTSQTAASSSATNSSSGGAQDQAVGYNMQLTEKWAKHLNKNEHVIKAGVIYKKRKMSVHKRQLLLTDTPRLIYIDIKADETKGTIPFSTDMTLDLKSQKCFHVKTPNRKYILEDEDKNASLWIKAIQVQLKKI